MDVQKNLSRADFRLVIICQKLAYYPIQTLSKMIKKELISTNQTININEEDHLCEICIKSKMKTRSLI